MKRHAILSKPNGALVVRFKTPYGVQTEIIRERNGMFTVTKSYPDCKDNDTIRLRTEELDALVEMERVGGGK